jgi:hypothetical protein
VATDYDTALMPRTTADSQAYPADFVCWWPIIGRHVAPHCRKYIRQIAGKCLELLTLKRGQVNLLSNSRLICEHADEGAKDVPTRFDGCGGVGDLAIRTAAAAIHVAGRHSNDFMRLRLRSTITHRHFIEG